MYDKNTIIVVIIINNNHHQAVFERITSRYFSCSCAASSRCFSAAMRPSKAASAWLSWAQGFLLGHGSRLRVLFFCKLMRVFLRVDIWWVLMVDLPTKRTWRMGFTKTHLRRRTQNHADPTKTKKKNGAVLLFPRDQKKFCWEQVGV